MQLSRIDLNLFTVFDAIYHEGGITAASKRLHLSQPAVSHALARLRELLGDPLFERRGHEMVPTPMARALAGSIRQSLGSLESMLQHAGQFDPEQSRRSFTIAVRESHELSFLPSITARISALAPAVDIATVRIDRRDLEEDLANGEIDAAIDVTLPLSRDVRRERVSSESLCVLARPGHPAGQALDLQAYLAAEHVLVTGRRRGGGYEDLALGRAGMARRIRVRCQNHAAASEIVAQSDLLATMSRQQAQVVNRHTRNEVIGFPLDIPPLETFLYWHANVDDDPASRWLRRLLLDSFQERAAAQR